MSDKINVQQILSKHIIEWQAKGDFTPASPIRAAIKEIVEAVVDKCAEANHDHPTDSHAQHILQVKQMINYGS